MKTLLILLAGTLVAGCAVVDLQSGKWQKPGARAQHVTAAELECARKTYTIGTGPDLVLGGVFDIARGTLKASRQASVLRGCMTAQGYTSTR